MGLDSKLDVFYCSASRINDGNAETQLSVWLIEIHTKTRRRWRELNRHSKLGWWCWITQLYTVESSSLSTVQVAQSVSVLNSNPMGVLSKREWARNRTGTSLTLSNLRDTSSLEISFEILLCRRLFLFFERKQQCACACTGWSTRDASGNQKEMKLFAIWFEQIFVFLCVCVCVCVCVWYRWYSDTGRSLSFP